MVASYWRQTAQDDLELSQRRAQSVVRFLVEHGVDASRLPPEGFGRTRPPTADDDPARRSARARRAAAKPPAACAPAPAPPP